MRAFISIVVLLSVTGMANAFVVNGYECEFLTPGTYEQSYYAGWDIKVFDDQPIWDPVLERPVNGDSSYDGFGGYSGRWLNLDFGENWADTYIVQTWTHYAPYTTQASGTPYDVRWDTDQDRWNGQYLSEGQINFHTNAVENGGSGLWYNDMDVTTPVQCKARYLWFISPSPDNNRMNEWAIVGYVVPEPATMALLAFGGMAALLRRKR